MSSRTHALVAVLAAAAVSAAADDLTIVSKVTREGAEPSTETSYLTTDRARISQAETGQDMMIDVKSGQMTVIDGRRKEYYVITRQDVEQMKAKLQQTMNSPEMLKAQEQMKNLPPDVQKRMQAAMGGMAASFDVKKTGATRTVAGYPCEEWAITFGTISKTTECVSTAVPIPLQTWDAYRDFSENMRAMMSSMGPMGKGMGDMQSKMKDVKGLPLWVNHSSSMMGRSTSTTTEVTQIKKGAIPASAWEIPAGYKKVDSPMVKALAGK
jgi:uncharacterized protein DUF4412